jgi:hypothetical protein
MSAPRYTADSITDDALDELYANASKGWRRGDRWKKRAEELEDALTRIRALAPMLDGLDTLLATSSRDWGEYRVDAWLWAVLVGWDCEDDHEHDETCDNGAAMQEMADRHKWDDAAVDKARRYREAVRAMEHLPGLLADATQPTKETSTT